MLTVYICTGGMRLEWDNLTSVQTAGMIRFGE